jgi:antitoxin component of RelBE/YafQ-DinJ toxin-antitoxin module
MSNNLSTQILVAIRMSVATKQELVKVLSSLGLSLSSYFRLAAQQLIIQKKVPFDLVSNTIANSNNRKLKKRKVMVSFQIPRNVKRELTELLSIMGLTITSYFVLAAEQLIIQKKIPFEIKY